MNIGTALASAAHYEPPLAAALDEVAGFARQAATFARGEYLPQMTRSAELERSHLVARVATGLLEDLRPQIAQLDGGETGLALATRALRELEAGREALEGGVGIEDDVLRGGSAVVDAVATREASARFGAASDAVKGIADLARIEATPADVLLRELLGS